jgi:hypothetical protein
MSQFWQVALLTAAGLGTLVPNVSQANQTVTICIGDVGDYCEKHDAEFKCGTTPQQAAAEVCSIWIDGQKRVQPFRLWHRATAVGGRCGNTTVTVQCLDASSGSVAPLQAKGQ